MYCHNSDNPNSFVFESSPKDVFKIGHLFSFYREDGSRDPILEEYFSDAENVFKQLVSKIIDAIRSREIPRFSKNARDALNLMIYLQMKRSPDWFGSVINPERFEDEYIKVIDEYEREFGKLEGKEKAEIFTKESKLRTYQNSFVASVGTLNPKIIEYMNGITVNFAKIEISNCAFIVGSAGVTDLRHPIDPSLENPRGELWIPISSDVSIVMTGNWLQSRMVTLSRDQVRQVNKSIAARSTLIASRSESLTKSISKYAGSRSTSFQRYGTITE